MSVVFVTCFVLGLVLGVYVMLHGVERRAAPSAVPPHEARGEYDPSTEPSAMLNAQNAAAFLGAFGACGYLLLRFTGLGTAAVVGLAVAAGGLFTAVSVSLLAAWVLPGARAEAVDERYLMQGHPAQVTRPIGGEADGEIVYEVDGRQFTVGARSWDGGAIDVGTDVAIERVENGIAYVERWAHVEARL